MAKDFRKDVRVMMARLHKKKTTSGQETTSLAALSPEVQGFIQKLADDWHAMLSKKRPRVVAKKMQKEKRSLPSGLEEDHFRWLCRFMARWHRRHAHKCDVMSGWSSGETSGEEDETARAREKKQKRREKKGEKPGESGLSDSEDTEKVSGLWVDCLSLLEGFQSLFQRCIDDFFKCKGMVSVLANSGGRRQNKQNNNNKKQQQQN